MEKKSSSSTNCDQHQKLQKWRQFRYSSANFSATTERIVTKLLSALEWTTLYLQCKFHINLCDRRFCSEEQRNYHVFQCSQTLFSETNRWIDLKLGTYILWYCLHIAWKFHLDWFITFGVIGIQSWNSRFTYTPPRKK